MSINSNKDIQNDDFFGDGEHDPTNWKREELLGNGAQGTVYRATKQTPDGVSVLAVKIFLSSKPDKMVEDSFKKEINALRQLSHVRIVKYYGACTSDSKCHIFLEYMAFGTLSNFIKNKGPIDEYKASQLCKQILEGVAYMHDMDIFHRDIKSDNVLMTDENNIKLADFGLTRKCQEITGYCTKGLKGTTRFMAPEILSEKYDKPVDLWSVGCVLIHMLTGEQPYPNLNQWQILGLLAKSKTPAKELTGSFSKRAKQFLKKSLLTDPKKRASAKSLLMDAFITELGKTRSPTVVKKKKPNSPSRSPVKENSHQRSLLPDKVLPLYNNLLKNTMRETFITSINPENILNIFPRYKQRALAKKDIDCVKMTYQLYEKQEACKSLLDLLARNKGWFQCLSSCLKDSQVNLNELAATFEIQEDAVYKYCSCHLKDFHNIQKPRIFYGGGKSDSTNWQKHEQIGTGFKGHVYRATIKSSLDVFAVKETRLKPLFDKKGTGRKGIITMENVSHERIIKFFGFSSTDLAMYLFYEYIPHGSLKLFIDENGIVNESKVKVLTKQILEAVAYIHAAGFIHGDIKSSDVLMLDENNVKLSGLSLETEYGELTQSLTDAGDIWSFRFMAPEKLLQEKYSMEIDIWSLGCVVSHMLTGKPPFYNLNDKLVVLIQLCLYHSPISDSPVSLPESAVQFLEKTFETKPTKRPSAEFLLTDTFITEAAEEQAGISSSHPQAE